MICNKCNKNKNSKDFYVRKESGKHRKICKECMKKDWKIYKSRNREKIQKSNYEYSRTESGRFSSLKSLAKYSGIDCKINFKEFKRLSLEPCYYCGDKFDRRTGYGIDRIDSEIGYEIGNCVASCSKCNFAKHTLSILEFEEHILKITKNIIRRNLMAKELSDAQAWSHISEMFGNTVRHPQEMERVETFTTRSPALDRALQVGGWARGRIYQMAGKPSSGKTFMSLVAMAEWQSKDPENCCAFIDAEFTYDPDWAESLGIDNDRILLIKSNEALAIFEGLCGRPKVNKTTGKTTQIPGLLDMIKEGRSITQKVGDKTVTLNLGKMGVIVLDSIAAMIAPAESQSEVGKVQVAPLARFLTVELRKLTPMVAHANVCFIAINHVKTKVGVMFGNPDTTPGGAAFKHACSVMLMVAPMSGADNTLVDTNEEKFGHKIRIKVEKNKIGKPFKKAEFFIDFTSGVTKVEEQLLDLGCMYNIFERPNNRTYIINGETLTSRNDALQYIQNNRDVIEELVRASYINGDNLKIDSEGKQEDFAESAEELFEM